MHDFFVYCTYQWTDHYFDKQNGKVSEAKTTDFAQKDESYRVMEANDREVMNLMRKDYKGMNKPGRKPPINNHKPTDWSQQIVSTAACMHARPRYIVRFRLTIFPSSSEVP